MSIMLNSVRATASTAGDTDQTVNTVYPVMEHFYTLQGEGFHQGTAAYFIRLAGCDVGCVWCDVKESWESSKHPLIKGQALANDAANYPAEICVVTVESRSCMTLLC